MNIKNYKKVLKKIKAHPETWDQRLWHCGTAHCFGGHAQIFSGREANDCTIRFDARIWLNISLHQADYLFDMDRTIEDFEGVLKNGFYCIDGYDLDGFDVNGFDRYGYDRHGYDLDGLDKNNKPRKPI